MLIVHFIIFTVLGAIFGFAGGLFGIGGAFLAIPALGIFAALTEQLAQGTAIAMALPNVVVGLWSYSCKAKLDWRLAGTSALTGLPFTYGAARIATLMPSAMLRTAFSGFLIVIALDMARRTFFAQPRAMAALPWPYATISGAISGVCSGFFGIGGAVMTVPAMTMFFGFTQLGAQGMALAFAVPSTILTTVTYAMASDVDWTIAIPLALGGVMAVSLGASVAQRCRSKTHLAFAVHRVHRIGRDRADHQGARDGGVGAQALAGTASGAVALKPKWMGYDPAPSVMNVPLTVRVSLPPSANALTRCGCVGSSIHGTSVAVPSPANQNVVVVPPAPLVSSYR